MTDIPDAYGMPMADVYELIKLSILALPFDDTRSCPDCGWQMLAFIPHRSAVTRAEKFGAHIAIVHLALRHPDQWPEYLGHIEEIMADLQQWYGATWSLVLEYATATSLPQRWSELRRRFQGSDEELVELCRILGDHIAELVTEHHQQSGEPS